MLRALYSAASGLVAQQFNIDTISNNLANVNTTGYKKIRPEFQDLFYSRLQRPAAERGEPPLGLLVGHGVRPSGSQSLMDQGNPQKTDNALDVALMGRGFFVVSEDREGLNRFYTRDGSFRQDADGDIVTSDGYYVLSENWNVINIPGSAQEISIDRNGLISYTLSGDDQAINAGRLGVVRFANPVGLAREGHNLYQVTAASGNPQAGTADSTVEQYYLESANVQVVDEIINLITAQRAYELNSKAVQAADEMLGIANNLRR
ncbi:MAG: flagellar basal-body rod protein FlgG [Syntrophaceticus sp.]|jgi:flagellar basal-body rod protein FlgG